MLWLLWPSQSQACVSTAFGNVGKSWAELCYLFICLTSLCSIPCCSSSLFWHNIRCLQLLLAAAAAWLPLAFLHALTGLPVLVA